MAETEFKGIFVIQVTRLNGTKLYINAELIQSIEPTPDTVITLTTNTKIVVKDPPKKLVDEIIEYHRLVRGDRMIEHTGE